MEKRRNFKPEEKAKIVMEVLREERTLTEIAAEYEVHPNQLSRWKAEFIQNAGRASPQHPVFSFPTCMLAHSFPPTNYIHNLHFKFIFI